MSRHPILLGRGFATTSGNRRVYPVLFLDAPVCKVRTDGVVRNRAVHLAVGIDVAGRKEVLGIWLEATEGAKFWLRVMNELRARGV